MNILFLCKTGFHSINLTQKLCNVKNCLQVNTKGAETLYNTVKEIAEVSPITTLLDICCGTGKFEREEGKSFPECLK